MKDNFFIMRLCITQLFSNGFAYIATYIYDINGVCHIYLFVMSFGEFFYCSAVHFLLFAADRSNDAIAVFCFKFNRYILYFHKKFHASA